MQQQGLVWVFLNMDPIFFYFSESKSSTVPNHFAWFSKTDERFVSITYELEPGLLSSSDGIPKFSRYQGLKFGLLRPRFLCFWPDQYEFFQYYSK